MLKNVSHAGGVEDTAEILFTTPFGYMFPDAAKSPECVLAVSERTEDALLDLGNAMGDASEPPDPSQDSAIPAAFTYLGQFIDHDVTAQTDREIGISRIAQADGRALPIAPLDPDLVVASLRNGRRPQLDLDSVYGDGPSLIEGVRTEASELYVPATKRFLVQNVGLGTVDVPRHGRKALVGDMRNDENVNVSQLHAAFLSFHNKVADLVSNAPSAARRYAKAREIVRWTYQYIVVHDYLKRVCDAEIVNDLLRNGPRFFGAGTGGTELFMPLEFSVAGFRFGHSMIRPSYRLGAGSMPRPIRSLLGVSVERPPADDLLEEVGGQFRLKAENRIAWSNFLQFPGEADPQKARRIDPLISRGLFDLPFEGQSGMDAMIRHLAQRNLCRAYLLRIPTGQAMAAAMGIVPLIENELIEGEPPAVAEAFARGRLHRRTPLWYYVLREAKVQKNGQSLGAVGSTLVAETLLGFLKHDPTSFLNNAHHGRVRAEGIKVPMRFAPIATLADLIDYTGLEK